MPTVSSQGELLACTLTSAATMTTPAPAIDVQKPPATASTSTPTASVSVVSTISTSADQRPAHGNSRGNYAGRISSSTSPMNPSSFPEPTPAHAPLQFPFAKSAPVRVAVEPSKDGPNFTPSSLSSISSIDGDEEDDFDGDDFDGDDDVRILKFLLAIFYCFLCS